MPDFRRILVAPLARAAAGGLLLATGGPPFPPACIGLSFLGVVLFASSLDGVERIRHGIVRGLVFGFAANLIAMSFVPGTITRFTDLPLAAALLALALLAVGQGAVFS